MMILSQSCCNMKSDFVLTRAKKKWTSLSTSSHHTRLSTHQSTNDELTITCQSGNMLSDLTQSVLIVQIVKLFFSLSAILIVSQDPKRAAARIPATSIAAIPSDMRRPVVVIPNSPPTYVSLSVQKQKEFWSKNSILIDQNSG